ncbi:MAG: hypothetical protein P8J17_13005, partial [Halioglobus sp.]|nr:hypothetical protein [Halioglobus sp.]
MLKIKPFRITFALCVATALAACSDNTDVIDLLQKDSAVTPPPTTCDPLTPSYCGFPYPNDYWSVEDPDTSSGRRLALPADIFPITVTGQVSETDAVNEMDGFSPGIAAMVHLPGATVTGLATPDSIEASL